MVLTCDCHPRLADEFTPELTDRLLGGAVWGVLTVGWLAAATYQGLRR